MGGLDVSRLSSASAKDEAGARTPIAAGIAAARRAPACWPRTRPCPRARASSSICQLRVGRGDAPCCAGCSRSMPRVAPGQVGRTLQMLRQQGRGIADGAKQLTLNEISRMRQIRRRQDRPASSLAKARSALSRLALRRLA